MKKNTLLLIGILFICFSNSFASNRYWIATSTSNWDNSMNWSTSATGIGGASIPTIGDFVYFSSSRQGDCNVDTNITIDGININSGYTGTIDLAGFSFNPAITGTASCTFAGGTIMDSHFSTLVAFTSTGQTIFSGTTFNIPINVISGRIQFSGGIYNFPVVVEDNGGSNTNGIGGCTFNSRFQVTNSGTSYFLMGNTNPDVFNGDVTLINTSSSRIRMAHNSTGTEFNGNIYVSSNNGSGIYFGENTGTATLAASKTITVSGSGFTMGDLLFKNFVQTGSASQSLNLTGTSYLKINTGTVFNGDFIGEAPQLTVTGSTFNGTTKFTKTGAGGNNSGGGNIFTGNCEVNNSGSGNFTFGNGSPDSFLGNVVLNNSGTSSLQLAFNSIGNTIQGSLTANNLATGTNTYITLSQYTASSLTIDGPTTLNNATTSSNGQITAGDNGDITFNNGVTVLNNATGTSGSINLGAQSNSTIIINGTTHVTNNGSGTTRRIYLGNSGDITFNGYLSLINTASATNSEIYLNHSSASQNIYNENISVTNSHSSGDGVRFGQSGGAATLANSRSLLIGSSFVAGELRLRNFTQVGTTSHSLTLTGTANMVLDNATFGGNVRFTAPRMNSSFSTYSGTSYLEKSGATDDNGIGGNTFIGNCELKNTGSGNFYTGNGNPDVFNGNVLMNNNGTKHMSLAHNSAGNTVAGTLTLNNAATGTNTYMYLSSNTNSTLTVDGIATFNNNTNSSDGRFYIGENGDIDFNSAITVNNNANGTSGYVYVAANTNSNVSIDGTVSITNNGSGTNRTIYLSNNGDIQFNGDLTINNNSGATNSAIYANHSSNSANEYNGNISISNTNSSGDGIRFGQSGGSGILAATKTISINSSFVAGELQLKQFTQVGNTAQSLIGTGTTYIAIDNSSFGGNIDFRAGRINTARTTYSGTTFLEKTGATDDASAGGNTFDGNCELKNTGSGYFYMGNGNPDVFNGNLLMNNNGTKHMSLAHNSAGNTVAGTLNLNNAATGTNTYMYLASNSNSSLIVDGIATFNNTASSNDSRFLIGENGDIDFNSDITVNSNANGTSGYVYVAANTNSNVSIDGTASFTNNGSGTNRTIYLGNSGDIQFNNDLTITNNSGATNSAIYANYSSNSANEYNGNISISNTHSSGDGIRFGQNGGSGVLAATKTISIGTSFVAGELQLKQFTQVGNTPQTLICTGSSYLAINNSSLGGNIDFRAGRINTAMTTYSGTTFLEKTGSSDDASVGGNVFVGNTELKNTGTDYFLMGNGSPDLFQGNLILTNSGTEHIYIAHNSVGNLINGTLVINNAGFGTNNHIYLANNRYSSLTINQAVQINNTSSATTSNLYLGYQGSVTYNDDLTILNTPNGTNSTIYMANDSASTITINGTTNISTTTGGSTRRMYLGNNGDIIFNGDLNLTHNADANYSEVHFNQNSNSQNQYNGNIVLTCNSTNSDGVRFGASGGSAILAATKRISIGANGYKSGELRLRNFTQVGATPQMLPLTGTGYLLLDNSNWGGSVYFSAPRLYTKETVYNGTVHLEKNGGISYDNNYGGNVFHSVTNLKNSGSQTFNFGETAADTFNADLNVINSGTSNITLAKNIQNHYVNGNLTIFNTGTGTGSTSIYIAPGSTSSIHITGNVLLNQIGSANQTYSEIGGYGAIIIDGNLMTSNSGTGSSSQIVLANRSASNVIIHGNTSLYNGGAATTRNRYYVGSYGDITFNGALDMVNDAGSTESEMYIGRESNSQVLFNDHVTISSLSPTCDGFYFGDRGGSSILAATKTITIPGDDQTNFQGGNLRFYNFTQTGNTPHSFELANTALYIYSNNSTWGGTVSFIAPRTYMQSSTFSNGGYFEKKGKDHDDWYGGNIFNGNTEIVQNNTIGTGRLYLANSQLDTYNGNLTLRNKGSFSELLCGNKDGTYDINGDLNIIHETTGTSNQYCYIANKNAIVFNVSGNATITNSSSAASGSHNVYISNKGIVNIAGNVTVNNTHTNGVTKNIILGAEGDLNIGGNLDITNNSEANTAQIIMANSTSSGIAITGNTTLSNSGAGTNKQCYLGNYGDIIFNGDIDITNNSSAASSEIRANYRSNSNNQYNGNITLKSTQTTTDGFLFGDQGGSGILAATKTISIPGGTTNFIGGQIYLRNFTQIGNTPQTLEIASSAYQIYNYNNNWGGNVSQKAPRIFTRGTTFNGTTQLEKTGANSDASTGDNTFVGNATLTNSGTSYFLMGNGNSDEFQSNLTLNNLGSNHMYLAHNSAGNTIAGDFTINHNASGSDNRIYVSTGSSSTLSVGGLTSINNASSATNSNLYIGDQGDISFNGGLNINNMATGTNGQIILGNNSKSSITINGATQVTNAQAGSTRRIFLGYNGDLTFNGDITVANTSNATNSEIYFNQNSTSSNTYNGNISLSSSVANCDGIRFGNNSGLGVLANSKTISIGGAGFISGYLTFRNFTQLGSTVQNISLTGSSTLSLNTAEWNGITNFISPRLNSVNSIFNASCNLEKTGANNDLSTGGNTFNANAVLTNSGTGYFAPANQSANDYNGNATFVKTGTGNLYPAYNCISTFAKDISVNATSIIRFGNSSNGRVNMDGVTDQNIYQLGTAANIEIRDLQTSNNIGEIILNTPVVILTELDLDNGNVVTNATNSLTMNDNSSVSSVSDHAYVDGPVLKYGNDSFIFPTGNGGHYAPIQMSRPNTSTFEATYHHSSVSAAGYDTAMVSAGLDHISNTEYWVLNRLSGSSNVTTTVSFDNARSNVASAGAICNVRIARWNGIKWLNEGNGGSTGNLNNGTIATGTNEDCSSTSSLTDWTPGLPIALAVDSNYITWDGTAYDGGTGTADAPGPSDGTRVLKVYAPNAILPGDASVAQVIVTATGNLTVEAGTVLEVHGPISNAGEMTIESGASLIQTTPGANTNTGDGKYKVRREGNASTASYNIWSSPIQEAQLKNIFSSSNPCDVWAFEELTQAWKHDYAIGYSSNCYGNTVTFSSASVIAGGDGLMDVARGYFVPGSSVTTRAYLGDVNNGDISISIATTNLGHNPNWDNDDWNLVGNPYPSALNAAAFLKENATDNNRIDGAIYFWDAGDTNAGYNQHSDYATYNLLGGVRSGNSTKTPAGEIASGQGFWVYAHSNTNLVFNNSMRSSGNDQFFKTDPSDKHLAWIDVVNPNNFKNNILIGYNETTTDSVDPAYDAHKLEGSGNIRFASLIGQDEFAIQGFKSLALGESKSIPLVIWSADSGIHVFSNYQLENIPSNIKIYMKDNELNVIHDLSTSYSIDLDANVEYNTRFELVFENNVEIVGGGQGSKGTGNDPGTDTTVTSINQLELHTYSVVSNANGFTLSNPNGINGTINVLDITGKLIYSSLGNANESSLFIDLGIASSGIYFVEVIANNQRVYSKKILKQ